MAREKSIVRNYIYNLSYQILAVLTPLIITPHVSRALLADGIGVYSYTYSIAYFFYIFGNLGISTYGQLEIAKNRDDKVKCSKIFWEISIARGITVLLTTLAYVCMCLFTAQYKNEFLVLVIYLIAGMFEISWFFQGLEEFKLTVMRNTVIKLISMILILLMVDNKDDLILYILILHGSTLIGNLSLWGYLRNRLSKVSVSLTNLPNHWKLSIIYFVPTIASSVYHVLDKTMIGWITKSAYENGYYEQAHKIEQVLLTVIISLATVTVPRIANLINKGERNKIKHICSETVQFVQLISIPMMIGMIVVAPRFIPIFLGDGFEDAVILLQLFSILFVVVGLSNTIGKQCIIAVGNQSKFNFCTICGAVCNIFANIILIYMFAAVGATIASVLAETVVLILSMYFGREYLDFGKIGLSTVKYGFSGIVMGTMISYIDKIHMSSDVLIIGVQVCVGCIVYLALLLLLRDEMFYKYLHKFIRKA